LLSQSSSDKGNASEPYSSPVCIANWKAQHAGEPVLWTMEFPIHSDAWITGQIDTELGPYSFLNAIRIKRMHEAHLFPAIVLRIDWHVPAGDLRPNLKKTDTRSYHGGRLEDELAALLGLCLGIRAKAGDQTRHFDLKGDPKGQPSAGGFKTVPQIQFSRQQDRILPWACGTHSLDAAGILSFKQLHSLSYETAAAVIRAARLHQEALWIAEGAPEMAWLLLAAAVETAASRWRSVTTSPLDWLKKRKPGLCERFLRDKREDLLELVADELHVGATAQFLDFLMAFHPGAPSDRPQEGCRHSWKASALKKSLRRIYDGRSKFVHSGIPFPAMMCMCPTRDDTDRTRPRYAEITLGSGFAVAGGAWHWKKEDAPMQLHIFEYIVRGALLEWWKWCLPSVSHLNSASVGELKGIPGIGTKLASNVISYRASHGQYESFDDLRSVAGMGQKTAAAIKTHTTLVKK